MAGSNNSPQFFPNNLQPIPINEASLRKALHDLRAAVRTSIKIIQSQYRAPHPSENDTIFSGSLGEHIDYLEDLLLTRATKGIALMFLRLERQANALSGVNHSTGADEYSLSLPDIRETMKQFLDLRPLELSSLQPGRSSPLCSPSLGSLVMRILAATYTSNRILSSSSIVEDAAALRLVVQTAIQEDRTATRNGHSMGVDEVLYGRAGLLWALTSIDECVNDTEIREALQPALEMKSRLRETIVDAGRKGAEQYAKDHSTESIIPLMWPWIDTYCGLGAMHGSTGILTILLSNEMSHSDYRAIAHTITALCKLCISEKGHLPMSVPSWPSARSSPLVQICHGTPGLLLLLAAAKRTHGLKEFQGAEWDEALRLGSERVWEEGLLSKGGGLCHGIAGNAWPWLLLYETCIHEEIDELASVSKQGSVNFYCHATLSADLYLSRALALLLAAKDTPPYSIESPYRTPDNPFSLFEGLAGTICAWAEACAVITARLRHMETLPAEVPRESDERQQGSTKMGEILGFPGLGGMGPYMLL